MDGVVLGKWSCYVACAKGLLYSKLITYTCIHYMLGACTIAHLIFSIFVGIMLLPLVLIPLITKFIT